LEAFAAVPWISTPPSLFHSKLPRDWRLLAAFALLTVGLSGLATTASADTHENVEDRVQTKDPGHEYVIVRCSEDYDEGAQGCVEEVERRAENILNCATAQPCQTIDTDQTVTVVVNPDCYDCLFGVQAGTENGDVVVGYGGYYWCEHRVELQQGVDDCYGLTETLDGLVKTGSTP
jgi:hypothetical protein